MAELDAQLRLDIDQALRDINQLETALSRALGSVELRLDSTAAQRQLDDLAQAADQALGDVDINFDTGSVSRLNSELAGVERNLAEADTEADQLDGSLRRGVRAAKEMDDATGRVARGFAGIDKQIKNLVGGFAAFAAVRGVIGFATDAKDAFAELQDSANAVKVVFGESVGVIEEYGRTVAQSAGLSTSQFNQAASVLGGALQNVGFGADVAATKTIELTQRAADMASIMGGPVSEALGAIQSALRGETDPIERYSVSLSEAAVNAQAAALNFKAVGGEFSATDKAAARLSLIMEQTSRFAGDFANTSGDLANAQKTLAAEFENAKASLGEALLPIFQSLLDIGPEVIAAIEDLAPSFNAFAVSLGKLLEHRAGAADLLDVIEGFADVPRALGALGTILTAPFNLDTASQTFSEQINTQGLIDDMREGEDAASVLANRLAQVAREGKLSPAFIRDLTKVAGTDVRETAASLAALVREADKIGLEGENLRNVAVALAQLNSAGESSEAERAMDRARIAAGELAVAGEPAVTALEGIQIAAGEAGVSMGELLTSTDPLVVALREGLTPAQEMALAINGIGTDALVAADNFDRVLGPSIGDASDAMIDFSKNGKVSLGEFIRGLEETVAATLAFRSNMLLIQELDPTGEATRRVLELSPEEQADIAAQLVANPLQIPILAEASIDEEGLAAELREASAAALRFAATSPSPEQVDQWVTLLGGSQSPEVVDRVKGIFNAILNDAFVITDPALTANFGTAVVSAIETADPVPLQNAVNSWFGNIVPPVFPKPELPPPPTAQEKADIGGQILELFERDDALNEAAGFTADTFNDRLIVEMGTRAFATQEELDAFITHNFTQEDAATTAAEATAGAYEEEIIRLMGLGGFLSGADLGDTIEDRFASDDALNSAAAAAVRVNAAFWDGIGRPPSGTERKITTAVTSTLKGGLQETSPSRIFVDAGERANEAFWSSFEQAEGKISPVGMTAALDAALSASFADVEVPGFTPLVVASVEETNTAAVTAEMQAALGVSFADLELPEFTPIVTPTVGRISAAEMDAALDVSFADAAVPEFIPTVGEVSIDAMEAALAASFAEVDVSDEGVEARGTFMSGLSTPTSGETGRLRQSLLQTVDGAIQRQSPPKLFLDAGIDSAEAFWMGFEESDFTLPDWLQHLVGQFPAIAEAAAGSFRTSFEQLEGELPAVIQRSAEAVNLTQFDDLGAAIAQQLTTAVEGDFRLSPELDPLTAEQLLALNLDPITPVIGPADPLTVGQLQEMVDAANAARTVVESQLEAIQFDFELQGLQEDRAALIGTTGEVGIAAREAFMAGLSASTSEEVVQLRASILDAINSATESSSPSRLMLRLGGAAGDAYWSGFEQADMQLKVPIPTMTGKISTTTPAAAAGEGAGFTFAPTYVNTETRDLETVVARSEQLMGAVSGILNGRFKL